MQCIITRMLLLCICSNLKSVVRCKISILGTHHQDTVYLLEQKYKDPWIFCEAKRGPSEEQFGKHRAPFNLTKSSRISTTSRARVDVWMHTVTPQGLAPSYILYILNIIHIETCYNLHIISTIYYKTRIFYPHTVINCRMYCNI